MSSRILRLTSSLRFSHLLFMRSVAMTPGQTVLTRIRCSASSNARWRDNPTTAAFAAAYAGSTVPNGLRAEIEETLTIRP